MKQPRDKTNQLGFYEKLTTKLLLKGCSKLLKNFTAVSRINEWFSYKRTLYRYKSCIDSLFYRLV